MIRLENRPLNIPKSLALVNEPKAYIQQNESGLNPSRNENSKPEDQRPVNPRTVDTYDQVHLLWLWTGFLNVSK
ncbi:MAG: hypothetical protein WAO52_11405 [Prolixibacteraceae bacterium]